MKFNRVKEGEFNCLVDTKTIAVLIGQESNYEHNKFLLFGIDEKNKLGYAVRYGRIDGLRTW
jgi:hypothetical protein